MKAEVVKKGNINNAGAALNGCRTFPFSASINQAQHDEDGKKHKRYFITSHAVLEFKGTLTTQATATKPERFSFLILSDACLGKIELSSR